MCCISFCEGSPPVTLCALVSVFVVPGSSLLTGSASGRDGLWNLPFPLTLVRPWCPGSPVGFPVSRGLPSVLSFCVPLCVFFFLLLFFWEPEQLSLTDEIAILVLDNQSSFLGKSFMDGFYRRKTGRVLKNMKMKDPNVVEIDLLFLFVFVSVLCVWIRTNVGFLVKKTLVLGGTNKKQCGVRRFLSFSRGG